MRKGKDMRSFGKNREKSYGAGGRGTRKYHRGVGGKEREGEQTNRKCSKTRVRGRVIPSRRSKENLMVERNKSR